MPPPVLIANNNSHSTQNNDTGNKINDASLSQLAVELPADRESVQDEDEDDEDESSDGYAANSGSGIAQPGWHRPRVPIQEQRQSYSSNQYTSNPFYPPTETMSNANATFHRRPIHYQQPRMLPYAHYMPSHSFDPRQSLAMHRSLGHFPPQRQYTQMGWGSSPLVSQPGIYPFAHAQDYPMHPPSAFNMNSPSPTADHFSSMCSNVSNDVQMNDIYVFFVCML